MWARCLHAAVRPALPLPNPSGTTSQSLACSPEDGAPWGPATTALGHLVGIMVTHRMCLRLFSAAWLHHPKPCLKENSLRHWKVTLCPQL